MSSRRDYKTLFFACLIGMFVKILGNVVLVPRMAVNGIVLSNALLYGSNVGFLALMLRNDVRSN